MLAAMLLLLLQTQGPKTVLDGAYSDAQAARGKTAYTTHCTSCHGDALEGVSAPALTGSRFLERWRERPLDILYLFIHNRMPFGRGRNFNAISDNQYLDILTHLLKVNGYPAGSAELTLESAATVLLVGKNGPQPVPDGSLVRTVGCLGQSDGRWILSSATEPVRDRNDATSTPAELKASADAPLGSLTFRLAEIDAVPDFIPGLHEGHKMQLKGFLVRQPNAERINLSSIEMVGTCATERR